MTALSGAHVRIGGDPRYLEAFKHLCQELAKLNHPACPDVDWERVESFCLALFKKNGVDLQSAVAFVLAHGHQRGVDGLVQGFALLEGLLGRWPAIWPGADATRMEILDWLYQHVLVMLRGLNLPPTSLSALLQLQAQLNRLQVLLLGHVERRPDDLRTLQQCIAGLLGQLERSRLPIPGMLPVSRSGEVERVMPLYILPPAPPPSLFVIEPRPGKVRMALGIGIAGLLFVLAGWAGWSHWRADEAARLPEPTQLSSLTLFDAGSAELRSDSSMALANALVQILGRPGSLIVITGHADNTGDNARNRVLSRDRAEAVRAWMQRMSYIPDECFVIRDAADSQPVASNDSEPGRAANRRVDIRLVPQARGCGT